MIAVVLAVLLMGGVLLTVAMAFRSRTNADAVDLGKVIGSASEAIRTNFRTLSVASLLLAGLPTFAVAYRNYDLPGGEINYSALEYWLLLMPVMAIGYLLQAAIVGLTIDSMETGERNLMPHARRAASRIIPILGATLLSYLAILFGSIFFLVPGLMLLVAWSVIVPVLMVEDTSLLSSFSRSAELTKGSRWRIFALLVLFFVGSMIVSAVLELPAGLGASTRVGAAAAAALSSCFSAILLATLLASLYVELRRLKEGGSMRGLADIFQ